MPENGEIVRDCRTVGYKTKAPRPVMWVICPVCGKGRWVFTCNSQRKGKPVSEKCNHCHVPRGENNPNWKCGWYLDRYGYKILRLQKDDFFFPMADGRGYAREHRLVMAKHLCRCLLPWEVVHHKNGIKDDNRLENLQLLPGGVYHVSDAVMKQKLKWAQKKIAKQATEILSLRSELRQFVHHRS